MKYKYKTFFKILSEKKEGLLRSFILIISAITPFLIPLIKFSKIALVRDWGYFNGLSLVVHSSILHYRVFPIHNPWILGGLDILANPQSRVFSPLVIFDILFTAPYANLFALITLAIVGSFGFYKLITYFKIDKNIAVVGSIIYIHASWFTLHFSEGHIIFGSFMLIGLAFYYILRIQEKNFKIYYALLNSFFLLDGAIYTFIFTNLLLVIAILVCVNDLGPFTFFKSLYKQWKTTLISFFIFVSLSSAKLLPFLWLHKSRTPVLEFVSLPFNYIFHCLFDPFQDILKEINGISVPFQFHEAGVYIGLLSVILTIIYLVIVRKRKFIAYVLIAAFFFWMGSGWISVINPWHLFQKIPIVNNAHVQPRLFILSYLMFIILLCYALDYYKTRLHSAFLYSIIILLIAESLFVSSYPFYKVFTFKDSTCKTEIFNKLITSNTINKTITNAAESWGFDFTHYFITNTGAKNAGEPAFIQGDIKSTDDSDYRGEIYLTKGKGVATIVSYTPGNIHIKYKLDTISEIQLNTNYLLGWKTNNENIKISQSKGLVTLKPDNLTGEAVILYRPTYLYIIFPLFFIGLITSIFVLIRRK
jgi:hypothetical protein